MAAFLEQLAGALLEEHGTELGEVAVVLPSQRAGLYLRHALAAKAGTVLWSPEMFTLGTFMERLSGLRLLPMEELLFEAYEAYKEVAGGTPRELTDFIQWAPATLGDISEVDAHLVPLNGFYRDLRSWEELDWSFNTTPLSDGQQRLVRYWAMAGRLHAALNTRLRSAGAGTAGSIARMAAELEAPFTWQRIWFAGLNAFTPAELRVIDRAHDAGIARFAWDADRYYVEDAGQEAGDHLRTAIQRYGGGVLPMSDGIRPGKDLQVMRAPNRISQAWCAADIVRQLPPEEREHAAIVLADEALLPPLLEALDVESGMVNITMGLSLAQLPIGSLFELFARLWASRAAQGAWSAEDMDRALRHPYLRQGALAPRIDALLEKLAASGLSRLSDERSRQVLQDLGEEHHALAVAAVGCNGNGSEERLDAMLRWAQRSVTDDPFATEQIYRASIVMHRVRSLMERHGHWNTEGAWMPVITRLLRAARMDLFGEPLRGLQIMGLLESRALDQRHCILLGAQEGQLPASSIERSYIPFELRREYGLPLRDSSDAVQAYGFMRLLHRSQRLTLVHADDGTANGPSRYIAQLEHGLFAGNGPDRRDLRIPIPVRKAATPGVPNSGNTHAAIAALLAEGLSPTMLRTWLRCPLDLWFRYVLGLREPDGRGARIAGNVLGNALHATMERIYRPWLGAPLSAQGLAEAQDGFAGMLKAQMLNDVPAEVTTSGQPLLQVAMATRAGENFLRGELQAVQNGVRIVPQALEITLSRALTFAGNGTAPVVMMKGRMDRIDERDGLPHILDLKAGRVDGAALRIKEISLEALRGDKGYAAQLLLYAWLYLESDPSRKAVRAGLLPLQRSSASEGLYLRIGTEDLITRDYLPAITSVLREVVGEMLDADRILAHDPASRYCAFCAA